MKMEFVTLKGIVNVILDFMERNVILKLYAHKTVQIMVGVNKIKLVIALKDMKGQYYFYLSYVRKFNKTLYNFPISIQKQIKYKFLIKMRIK